MLTASQALAALAGLALVFACVCFLLASWRVRLQQAQAWSPIHQSSELLGAENGESQLLKSSSPPPTNGRSGDAAGAPPVPAAQAGAASSSTPAQLRTRMLCVCCLCLQYAAYALLRRYATGILKEDWSMASVLGAGEAIKFVVSLAAIGSSASASEAPEGPLSERTCYLLRHSAKMAVPAVLYLMMNMLGFVALRRVDAGTFAIIQQTKAFFTAAFQRALLGRTLSVPKWCTLTLLILGVTIISLEAQPKAACGAAALTAATSTAVTTTATSTTAASASATGSVAAVAAAASSYAVGVLAVTADSALSGYATVYFERVLKTTALSSPSGRCSSTCHGHSSSTRRSRCTDGAASRPSLRCSARSAASSSRSSSSTPTASPKPSQRPRQLCSPPRLGTCSLRGR